MPKIYVVCTAYKKQSLLLRSEAQTKFLTGNQIILDENNYKSFYLIAVKNVALTHIVLQFKQF